ncbi:MAG: hypothetical protein AAFV19_12975 [Pseudomonadota bacterium]
MQFWLDVWSKCKENFENQGLELRIIENHELAMRELERSDKPYITPHLSIDHNDLTSVNAFWGFILNEGADEKSDRISGVLGARMDQIPKGEIINFWHHHYYRLRDTDYGGVIDKNHVPPQLRDIHGRVAYFGDFFLLPKKQIDQTNFVMAALAYSEIKWSPDVTYAFIREGHAKLGQTYRLGFQKHCRAVHRWIEPPKERKNGDPMIYTMSEDTAYAAEVFLQEHRQRQDDEQNVISINSRKPS